DRGSAISIKAATANEVPPSLHDALPISIDASEVTSVSPVATLTDVLNARTPGVQIAGANATGVGARVRIRGASSLNLSNEAIYRSEEHTSELQSRENLV